MLLSLMLASIQTQKARDVSRDRAKPKNRPSTTGVFHFVSRPEKQAGDQMVTVGR